uniref:uncharacterized protein LOC129120352 n=1 Tax=Agelaius phoeniceus TaxID=39638 RepID=UPI0023EBD4D0|nr:uncharacterized protein LOC129120352 [Agelaius phoeniceus]
MLMTYYLISTRQRPSARNCSPAASGATKKPHQIWLCWRLRGWRCGGHGYLLAAARRRRGRAARPGSPCAEGSGPPHERGEGGSNNNNNAAPAWGGGGAAPGEPPLTLGGPGRTVRGSRRPSPPPEPPGERGRPAPAASRSCSSGLENADGRLGNDTCLHPHPARGTAGLTLQPLRLLSERFKAISQAGIVTLHWLPAQNAYLVAEKERQIICSGHMMQCTVRCNYHRIASSAPKRVKNTQAPALLKLKIPCWRKREANYL